METIFVSTKQQHTILLPSKISTVIQLKTIQLFLLIETRKEQKGKN